MYNVVSVVIELLIGYEAKENIFRTEAHEKYLRFNNLLDFRE